MNKKEKVSGGHRESGFSEGRALTWLAAAVVIAALGVGLGEATGIIKAPDHIEKAMP